VSSPTRRAIWEPLATFWRERGGVVLSMLLLVAAAWSSFFLFGSDDFYVYDAAVQGNLAVPKEEIFQASMMDSQSVFWINAERSAEAIARLPSIHSAKVICRLPAQIIIQVVERQAQVVWQWQNQQFWVDDHGVVLQPRGPLPDALVILDSSPAPPQLGGRVDDRAVVAAQQLHDLWPQVDAVTYSDRGLVLRSQGGWPIYLGVGDDMALKLAILEALEADLEKQGIQPAHIDLRYPQRPTFSIGAGN
jgi:cell division septal protein FtsQ